MYKNIPQCLIILCTLFSSEVMAQGKEIFGAECRLCHSNQNIKDFIQKNWINKTVDEFFLYNKKAHYYHQPHLDK